MLFDTVLPIEDYQLKQRYGACCPVQSESEALLVRTVQPCGVVPSVDTEFNGLHWFRTARG